MNDARAREYQKIKKTLTLFHLVFSPAILLLIALTPLSVFLKETALGITLNPCKAFILYFTFFSLLNLMIDLPFSVYSGFFLEHKFGLSNQTFSAWAGDFLKKSILSFALGLALMEGLYYLIQNQPAIWWVWAWVGYAIVSYVLGKLFPVLIVPIFYKYSPIVDAGLREAILGLAAKHKMPLENVYSINLSKTTKKANAAFMGMGKTRRVVLSDTLIDQFSQKEIEVVVAHELGHFLHKDIWRQFFFGLATSLISFWVAFHVLDGWSKSLGYLGSGDAAAMPLLFFVFFVASLVLTPLQNMFSRMLERAADRFALDETQDVPSFISCMKKLGEVNLADSNPHPLYEWFFYDHPAISKRIRMAETKS